MDRLQAMETFVRVVESGSFSAVAREQNSAQSMISKQVAALEAHLGAKLLTRTTRKLQLTIDGERYFEQARRLVAEVSEAEATFKRGEQELKGLLRVAAAVGFGRLVLLPLVQSFLAQHPQVKIDLKLNDGFVDLIGQGVDISVRVGDLADSSLIARRIGTARRVLLASRDYFRQTPGDTAQLRHPQDLLAHNCIVYTGLTTGNEWTFIAGAGANAPVDTQYTIHASGNLQTNSSEIIRAAIISGMGISYSPTWLFERELASGEVQILLPDWLARPVPIHLVSPPQRRNAAKVRAFAEHVAQHLR
ncbi:MAG: hypothetical protein RL748_4156 [Pseudomonadota bacterium]|jgi:DNA-binding transcriptional LysR family regulator